MTTKISTGLAAAILSGGSVKSALSGGIIRIYGGSAPAGADDAATGTLLVTVSLNGDGSGLELDDAVGQTMGKPSGDMWGGVVVATGTATHFRWVRPDDTGAASSTAVRLQGSCGTAGAQLNMSSVNLVLNAVQTIDSGAITMPMA